MYYLYKTTNLVNGKYYIGVHYSQNIQNDSYLGSGKALHLAIKKYGNANFRREILQESTSKQWIYKVQKQIVNSEIVKDSNSYNILIGGMGSYKGGQTTKGKFVVTSETGQKYMADRTDVNWITGKANIHSKNKVSVKDKDGNTFQVDKDDPRYISRQLVGVLKDSVIVKDKEGNKFRVGKDDPRYISGQLVGINKGNKLDYRNYRGELHHMKGKIRVYNTLTYENLYINSYDSIPKDCVLGAYERITQKTREKRGSSTRGKRYMHKQGIVKVVSPQELQLYLNQGWSLGRT